MALIIKRCSDCKKEIKIYVGQQIFGVDLQLVWHSSYSCSNCGTQIEEDGYDIPTDEIREAILAQEGTWSLNIRDIDSYSATIVIKILRKTLKLSLSDAIKLKKKIPGKVMEGTKVEVNRLQQFLARHGFQSLVSKSEILL
ncbi:MAG: hypothetical protein WBA93_20665 [Microcoleaceae cyanobacterium]